MDPRPSHLPKEESEPESSDEDENNNTEGGFDINNMIANVNEVVDRVKEQVIESGITAPGGNNIQNFVEEGEEEESSDSEKSEE